MLINPYWIGCGPSYQQLPKVLHGRAPVEIMPLLGLVKAREGKEEGECRGSVKREMHTYKGGYLKYRTNDWKEGES